HVDVCADGDEDRGSTPLASRLRSRRSGERSLSRRSLWRNRTFWFYNTHVAIYAPASRFEFMAFTYVYILQSEVDPERFYTGLTKYLRERMKRHNAAGIPHTSKWRPWTLKTYIGMSDQKRAAELEKYLKSHSGRAFVKKHL
ncbi:MAG: GIY-YIG nuclease family protein, partial [Terriglobales bacterium]